MSVFEAIRATAEELGVAGVSAGELRDGEARFDCVGVTSLDNPLEVTPDTYFQIGSISKTFTGSAVMYLVADGLIDLDEPVRKHVPELKLADEHAAANVTMRHLLTHTGGFVGDWFDDTGWGDDAVARYAAGLGELQQLTPLGRLWAYNNAGFALAGLVVERVTGERFEDVVQRLVLDPLELHSTTYWPWEVMTERFAVGHDEQGVARPWPVGRSAHPAGGLTSTTGDLLRYARLHLDPPPELAPMQVKEADTNEEGEWVGLTWYGEDRHGTIRHGGGTVGQLSVLVLQPSTGYALAVLTNHSPGGQQVIQAAIEAAGLGGPQPEPYPDAPVDDYVGAYESIGGRATFSRSGDGVRLDYEPFGGFPSRDSPAPPAPPPMEASFYSPDRWIVSDGAFKGLRGHFLTTPDGARWVRLGGRLYARVD